MNLSGHLVYSSSVTQKPIHFNMSNFCYTCRGSNIQFYGILIAFIRLKQAKERRDVWTCHHGDVIRLDGGLDVGIISITIIKIIGKSCCRFKIGRIFRICKKKKKKKKRKLSPHKSDILINKSFVLNVKIIQDACF